MIMVNSGLKGLIKCLSQKSASCKRFLLTSLLTFIDISSKMIFRIPALGQIESSERKLVKTVQCFIVNIGVCAVCEECQHVVVAARAAVLLIGNMVVHLSNPVEIVII